MNVLASNGSAVPWPSCPNAVKAVPVNRKKNNKIKASLVFKSVFIYKDLFFRVFIMLYIENKLKAKYKTKNVITDSDDVFFAIMNQMIVNSNSSRNLTLKEVKVCIVWL